LCLKFNLAAGRQSYREITFTKKSRGHKHLRVIELRKKKSSYSAVFEAVERKLLCIKTNLEAGRPSIPPRDYIHKKISLWHKHLAHGNRVT
jgi:hypothetical protein